MRFPRRLHFNSFPGLRIILYDKITNTHFKNKIQAMDNKEIILNEIILYKTIFL